MNLYRMRTRWTCVLPFVHLGLGLGAMATGHAAPFPPPTSESSSNLASVVVIGARWSNAPLAQLRQAAERGDVQAEFFLGWTYRRGIGVQSNSVEAARWYRRAADKNLAEAQARLGYMYEHGEGVPEDQGQARRWLEAAAAQGMVPAMVHLAWICRTRQGNLVEAAEWYERAAVRGDAAAQYSLAEIHLGGQIKRNEKEALKWLRKAADQGHLPAIETLGRMLRHNSFETQADPVEAAKWIRIAANAGRIVAQLDLAQMLDQGQAMPQNQAQAMEWYKRVAAGDPETFSGVVDAWLRLGEMHEQGLGTPKDLNVARQWYLRCVEDRPQALIRLGWMHENGEGVPRNDRQAAAYYEAALSREALAALDPLLNLYLQNRAKPEDAGALEKYIVRFTARGATARQLFLAGELYHRGVALPKDLGRAADLFTKAAALGSAEAQTRIGQFWQAGLSGQIDSKEAVRWFRRAAVQGAAEAQFLLGRAYSEGEGVEKAPVSALKWTMLAARQGHDEARTLQDKLESNATAQQIESARNQADQFQPHIESPTNAIPGRLLR